MDHYAGEEYSTLDHHKGGGKAQMPPPPGEEYSALGDHQKKAGKSVATIIIHTETYWFSRHGPLCRKRV